MIFILSGFFWGPPAIAWSAEKLVDVATLDDYIPYCFATDNPGEKNTEQIPPGTDSTRLQGYSWDVVRESYHAMGYTIRLTVVPWERAMNYLKSGKVDVLFPTAKTAEREKLFVYSKEIVNTAKYLIYLPVEVDMPWQGLGSLKNKRIAAIRGWSYGEKWNAETDIIVELSDSVLQCFQMLDKRHVFGVAGYDLVFDYTLKKEGIQNKYKKLPYFDQNSEYLTGNKANAYVYALVDDFDVGKQIIIRNGTLKAITSKWQ